MTSRQLKAKINYAESLGINVKNLIRNNNLSYPLNREDTQKLGDILTREIRKKTRGSLWA